MAGLVTSSSCSGVAEFAYDALGRRIKRFTKHDSQTTYYYHNSNWKVLAETDADGTTQRWFIYGNGTESPPRRIDEVLLIKADSNDYYYAQNHLYSPAALINSSGSVVERYEYVEDPHWRNAYGNCYILEPNFAPDPDGKSDYGNPYYFQGKRLDLLDDGGLELMSWPYRNYSTYLGRWLQAEKRGMIPNAGKVNPFGPPSQYEEGVNLYTYVRNNPVRLLDPTGLGRVCVCNDDCKDYKRKHKVCYLKVNKWTLACHARGMFLCGAVCGGKGFKHPACAVCVLGYLAACSKQEKCTDAYCDAMKRYCEGKRRKKPGFWTRMKCGGYFGNPWPKK